MHRLLLTVCILIAGTNANPIVANVQPTDEVQPANENVHEQIYKVNKNDDLNLLEGDIIVPSPPHISADYARDKRNAVRDRKRLWINKVVPYEFGYGFPVEYQGTVRNAIEEYHNKTCIRFKPKTNSDKQWILFVHKKGCWSAVGRSYWSDGTGQEISLGRGCNSEGTVIHEIMHALGFWHEQSRPDRNQYVEILWENIIKKEQYNFQKYSHGVLDTLKIPYDYDSIMHYGPYSFTTNGEPTIKAIQQLRRRLGQRKGLTNLDLQEINALYDCHNPNTNSPWSAWSDFGPCDSDCQKYRQRFCSSDNRRADCPTADYYGVQNEFVKCNDVECYAPVDGHWGRWSAWGKCDETCGYGKQTRTRRCTDPAPRHNGKNCTGADTTQQSCKVRSCGLGLDDCEFDGDLMCHWKNEQSNKNYKWERINGDTPSSGTGPTGDHTSKTGFYLYAESSSIPKGEKARLLSKAFNATEGRCLTFWYHMLGLGMGSLIVKIQDGNGERELWSKSGDQGVQWQLGQLPTIESTTPYKIIFESVRGPDFRSDIGLDDVKFDDSPCTHELGCYNDHMSDRTLPVMMENLRNKIDWYHLDKTVRDCALVAKRKGYKLFGIQFYGECWGGDNSSNYQKYGTSLSGCYRGVGGQNTNNVYKIV